MASYWADPARPVPIGPVMLLRMSSSDAAELLSLLATAEDLQRRITTMAQRYDGSSREDIVTGLHEVDRSFGAVIRKIHNVAKVMR